MVHCADTGASFARERVSECSLGSCRVALQPCGTARQLSDLQRELLLPFTAEKLQGQKTQSVLHCCLPAGHVLPLHLVKRSAQVGSFSADCALEREIPRESRTAPKTAVAPSDPPSIPYPVLTKELEEIRLVLSLTKYLEFTSQVKIGHQA